MRKSSSGPPIQAAIHAQERFTFEMHHQRVDASPGDNDGLIIKGLGMNNTPRFLMMSWLQVSTTLGQTREFDAQIHLLDIHSEIKVGCRIGFVRCGRAACRISKPKWKMGKKIGGKEMYEPHSLSPTR